MRFVVPMDRETMNLDKVEHYRNTEASEFLPGRQHQRLLCVDNVRAQITDCLKMKAPGRDRALGIVWRIS